MSKKKSQKKIPIEERIALCQQYTQQWAQFFQFFADGFQGRKITADDEAKFFRAMTELAFKEFRFSYVMGDDFGRGEEILAILSEGVSLNTIHEMSEAQFSKFQRAWHVVFIALNKCLGRLMQQRPQAKKRKGKKPAESKPEPAAAK